MKCKQCGTESLNGTNFCKRSCRISWIREHSVKGAKKKYQKLEERYLMSWGLSSSACDTDSIGVF